jgi:hypothetical protein
MEQAFRNMEYIDRVSGEWEAGMAGRQTDVVLADVDKSGFWVHVDDTTENAAWGFVCLRSGRFAPNIEVGDDELLATVEVMRFPPADL